MIDNILSFIKENNKDNVLDDKTLREYLLLHIKYNTCNILYNESGDIIAISRWDIKGDTAYILEVVVKKDYRRKGMLKDLVKIGSQMYPHVKYIEFERNWEEDSKVKKYKIERFL